MPKHIEVLDRLHLTTTRILKHVSNYKTKGYGKDTGTFCIVMSQNVKCELKSYHESVYKI